MYTRAEIDEFRGHLGIRSKSNPFPQAAYEFSVEPSADIVAAAQRSLGRAFFDGAPTLKPGIPFRPDDSTDEWVDGYSVGELKTIGYNDGHTRLATSWAIASMIEMGFLWARIMPVSPQFLLIGPVFDVDPGCQSVFWDNQSAELAAIVERDLPPADRSLLVAPTSLFRQWWMTPLGGSGEVLHGEHRDSDAKVSQSRDSDQLVAGGEQVSVADEVPPQPNWPKPDGWDFQPGEAAYNGSRFRIVGREAELLRFFAQQRPGQLVEMATIHHAIWNADSVNDETVRSCISRTNRRIREGLGHSRIQIVSCGKGTRTYKLDLGKAAG